MTIEYSLYTLSNWKRTGTPAGGLEAHQGNPAHEYTQAVDELYKEKDE